MGPCGDKEARSMELLSTNPPDRTLVSRDQLGISTVSQALGSSRGQGAVSSLRKISSGYIPLPLPLTSTLLGLSVRKESTTWYCKSLQWE